MMDDIHKLRATAVRRSVSKPEGESPQETAERHDYVLANFAAWFKLAIGVVHERNAKWWVDIHSGEPITRNFGEVIALCHSELSEALEGHRKNLTDDKLPHRPMAEVELADTVIRIMDAAGGFNHDVAGALLEKMAYNHTREDHKLESRRLAGGKAY